MATSIDYGESARSTPQQNDRTIVEKARCLIHEAKANERMWTKAVNAAVYLKIKSPHKVVLNLTPGKNGQNIEVQAPEEPAVLIPEKSKQEGNMNIAIPRRSEKKEKQKNFQIVFYIMFLIYLVIQLHTPIRKQLETPAIAYLVNGPDSGNAIATTSTEYFPITKKVEYHDYTDATQFDAMQVPMN
ncbi:hypothetical protein ILUMI_06768 [Ignelater luminosus]|uniref:Uncharacterized protein n=1 Tax=Ignelater luminosus TaxID=2038154 RepID=A0A8K0GF16_IGNLU|nr:hypothetical protein ILUMI_06768 [Ignelater luminosus]